MSATRPVGELKEYAAKLIVEKLHSLSVSQAARDLRVSRQAIYGLKSGDFCPSLGLIQRACAVWGLEFNFHGMKISERAFGLARSVENVSTPSQSTQLNFYDSWDQLKDQKMTVVRARRLNGAVEMTLRISIPA